MFVSVNKHRADFLVVTYFPHQNLLVWSFFSSSSFTLLLCLLRQDLELAMTWNSEIQEIYLSVPLGAGVKGVQHHTHKQNELSPPLRSSPCCLLGSSGTSLKE